MVAVAVAVTAALDVCAHRLDEYLQAARISIEPDRVQIELDLTPGIALADLVSREIDKAGTGAISASDGVAYASIVLNAIQLDIDGIPLRLELIDSRFPTLEAMHDGEGTSRLRMTAPLPRLRLGPHQLFYRNNHHSDIGVYLANALVPTSDRVAVTSQRRDVDQRELTISYVLRPDTTASARRWWTAGLAAAAMGLAATWLWVSGRGRKASRNPGT